MAQLITDCFRFKNLRKSVKFDATNIFSRSATDFGAGKKKGRAQMCVKWIVRGWRQIL